MRTTVVRGKRLWAVLSLSMLAVTASAQLSWTFDSGAQGWQQVEIDDAFTPTSGTLTWIPTGYVMGVNGVGTHSFFQSPDLDDASAYVGGTLSFSLASTTATSPSVLALYGNGGEAIFASIAQPPSGFSFRNYSVVLEAGNFFADVDLTTGALSGFVSTGTFSSIMGDLDALLLPVDFDTAMPAQVAALDNVSITAIPEPSTVAVLFGAAAVAVVALRRRQRR